MNRSQDLILWAGFFFSFFFFNGSIAEVIARVHSFGIPRATWIGRHARERVYIVEDGTVVKEESSVRRGIFGWETSESEFGRVDVCEPTFPVDDDQQSKFCIRFERYVCMYIYFGVVTLLRIYIRDN